MGSGKEIWFFFTHYFFRPLYLSIAIIRLFDRALPPNFLRYWGKKVFCVFWQILKKLPSLFPLPSWYLHCPITTWMNQLSTQNICRESECVKWVISWFQTAIELLLQDCKHCQNSDITTNFKVLKRCKKSDLYSLELMLIEEQNPKLNSQIASNGKATTNFYVFFLFITVYFMSSI